MTSRNLSFLFIQIYCSFSFWFLLSFSPSESSINAEFYLLWGIMGPTFKFNASIYQDNWILRTQYSSNWVEILTNFFLFGTKVKLVVNTVFAFALLCLKWTSADLISSQNQTLCFHYILLRAVLKVLICLWPRWLK